MNTLSMIHNAPDVCFPGLGISIENLPSGITLPIGGGFEIKFYGMIIAFGIFMGYLVACYCGKREKIPSDMVTDFLLYGVLFGVIGARLYYVIFQWDYYSAHPSQILNLRGGGLAIYGGVIASLTTLYIYSRSKKVAFLKMADTCIPGLVTGQLIGRWGNFFNKEAFGDYSTNFLRMCLKKSEVYSGYITQKLADNTVTYDGTEYIQVHPTFLYESMWNIGVLCVLLYINRHKKFNGNVLFAYLTLYGLGRLWIEGLRTDQLTIGSTGIAVSQVLSGVLVLAAGSILAVNLIKEKNNRTAGGEANQANELNASGGEANQANELNASGGEAGQANELNSSDGEAGQANELNASGGEAGQANELNASGGEAGQANEK